MALVNRKDVTSIIFCSVLLQKDQLLCMLHSLRTQSLQSLWKFSCHHTPPVEIAEHWALRLIFRSGQ